jgi:tetratricopeptide (TPR) repeat protein
MGFLRGFFTIFIPIGSLLIALLEYQGRIEAVKEKEKVEIAKNQAVTMLSEEVEREVILQKAKEELRPPKDKYKVIPKEEEVKKKLEEIEEYLVKGDEALKAGDLQKAEEFYSTASELEREEPRIKEPIASKSLAHLYLRKKEYDKAKLAFKRAAETNPEDLRAQRGLIYSEVLLKKTLVLRLRGCVINDTNDMPIRGARITVKGRDEVTSSDDAGNFILRLHDVPKDFQPRLRVEKEGFRPWERPVSTYQVIRIRLSPI